MLKIDGFCNKNSKESKVGLLGTCNTDFLAEAYNKLNNKASLYLYDSRFSPLPELEKDAFDYFVIGLTLRYIVADADENRDDFWYLKSHDHQLFESNLRRANEIISRHVDTITSYMEGKEVFYLSFFEAQANPMGVFANMNAITNPSVFVRKMNEHLFSEVTKRNNSFFVDVNTILSGIGRARLQDDSLYGVMHGNVISDFDYERDIDRIVPVKPAKEIFQVDNLDQLYGEKVVDYIENMRIIMSGEERVKLLVVDLDGTMWRGVAAEDDMDEYARTEGWPTGFVESLLIFKSRGGMLAINSKNDYEETKKRFDKIWGYKIKFEDFVSIKINWNSKSDNIKAILSEVNILSDSAVMIDDNPREISEIKAVFPELRTLGFDPYVWRYAIINYPEFQNSVFTVESLNKTDLVKAAINRSINESSNENREDWLQNLQLTVELHCLNDNNDKSYTRVLELINKTNQFNSTGKRWSNDELMDFISRPEVMLLYFKAKDKDVDNGLIGVCLVNKNIIDQIVLSCRVFSLGIEDVMFTSVQEKLSKGAHKLKILDRIVNDKGAKKHQEILMRFLDTGKNSTIYSTMKKFGFSLRKDDLYCSDYSFVKPDWINLKDCS